MKVVKTYIDVNVKNGQNYKDAPALIEKTKTNSLHCIGFKIKKYLLNNINRLASNSKAC